MDDHEHLVKTAWLWSAKAHNGQKYPGTDLPYLYHIGQVYLELLPILPEETEVIAGRMLCCAILHDIVEDTHITIKEIRDNFGGYVADGVAALTKNKNLKGNKATIDSLCRIKDQPQYVWCVKLADRIANLGTPPSHWTEKKIASYTEEAGVILIALGEASPFLARRLADRIDAWKELSIARRTPGL